MHRCIVLVVFLTFSICLFKFLKMNEEYRIVG
jgi:hypothetical protein